MSLSPELRTKLQRILALDPATEEYQRLYAELQHEMPEEHKHMLRDFPEPASATNNHTVYSKLEDNIYWYPNSKLVLVIDGQKFEERGLLLSDWAGFHTWYVKAFGEMPAYGKDEGAWREFCDWVLKHKKTVPIEDFLDSKDETSKEIIFDVLNTITGKFQVSLSIVAAEEKPLTKVVFYDDKNFYLINDLIHDIADDHKISLDLLGTILADAGLLNGKSVPQRTKSGLKRFWVFNKGNVERMINVVSNEGVTNIDEVD